MSKFTPVGENMQSNINSNSRYVDVITFSRKIRSYLYNQNKVYMEQSIREAENEADELIYSSYPYYSTKSQDSLYEKDGNSFPILSSQVYESTDGVEHIIGKIEIKLTEDGFELLTYKDKNENVCNTSFTKYVDGEWVDGIQPIEIFNEKAYQKICRDLQEIAKNIFC